MNVEILKVIEGGTIVERVQILHTKGLRLIRIKDFVRLGFETRPTLYDHIRNGHIKVYHPNGTPKYSSKNTPACICMNQWEDMYNAMPRDRAPITINIKPRASTATQTPRA